LLHCIQIVHQKFQHVLNSYSITNHSGLLTLWGLLLFPHLPLPLTCATGLEVSPHLSPTGMFDLAHSTWLSSALNIPPLPAQTDSSGIHGEVEEPEAAERAEHWQDAATERREHSCSDEVAPEALVLKVDDVDCSGALGFWVVH
jgi:hypothetical protein